MSRFKLQIYTQERKVFEGQVSSIVVPAATGYLGVLADHAPLVALLGKGRLTIKDGGGQSFPIEGGFIEVRRNVVTLLVDKIQSNAASAHADAA